VFYLGARPYVREQDALTLPDHDPAIRLVQKGNRVELQLSLALPADRIAVPVVTTERLGQAKIPALPYVSPDDSPLQIDTDYLGRQRDRSHPAPGPFEAPPRGGRTVRVW
jgi:hypothetical protein